MKNIMITTSGSGSLIDICLSFDFFKSAIKIIVIDRDCGVEQIAKKHNIECVRIDSKSNEILNSEILQVAKSKKIDYIFSYSFLRIFNGEILEVFKDKIFNSHFSILPAFRGYYDTRDKNRKFHPRQIFERMIDFNSRVTGNTIHIITKDIDEGCPVLVSVMNIPYNQDVKYVRHRLFIQECKGVLQLVDWLIHCRFYIHDNKAFIKNAKFELLEFSPNLDNEKIIEFDIINK